MAKSSELSKALFRIVGRKLAEVRNMRHFSQSSLAQKAKLTRAAISAIEAGQQGMSLVTVCQVALTLEVEPGQLLPTLDELQKLIQMIQAEREQRPADDIVDEFLRGDGS